MGIGNFWDLETSRLLVDKNQHLHKINRMRKMLGKRDTDALKDKDAEPWIRKIGKKPHKTVNDRKQQLHEYCKGKLKDQNIISSILNTSDPAKDLIEID